MMKTMYRLMLAGLLVCGTAAAKQGPGGNGEGNGGGPGRGQQGRGSAGVSNEDPLEKVRACCRAHSVKEADSARLVGFVRTAQSEQLPTAGLCEKIEEGLAKDVEVERVIAAVETRLDYLRQANPLVTRLCINGPGKRGEGPARLIEEVGMALESGLPLSVFEEVFRRQEQVRIGRLLPVVEAAEALQLAGLESGQTQRILIDFVERNLNRYEIQRVVEILQSGLAGGQDFEAIYASLWVDGN